jgi:hypothetical protein
VSDLSNHLTAANRRICLTFGAPSGFDYSSSAQPGFASPVAEQERSAKNGATEDDVSVKGADIMKEVFTHHDPTLVGWKKSILEQAGIDCFIRNETTSATLGAGALGLVQSPLFDPALCIVDDARYDEAMALLGGVAQAPAGQAPPVIGVDWRCPKCGETVPANFETCWNCGSAVNL